jgi:hypothetical protein
MGDRAEKRQNLAAEQKEEPWKAIEQFGSI